mgnify:CR=1 FL=1
MNIIRILRVFWGSSGWLFRFCFSTSDLATLINVYSFILGEKMVDVIFVGQLIESMSEAVVKLKEALGKGDVEYANRLRVFIFDVHNKIEEALSQVG